MIKTQWNTWNVRSVLSHALIEEGFALSLGILSPQDKKDRRSHWLKEALPGRSKPREQVTLGAHDYDSAYTSLELTWKDIRVRVETAAVKGHWYAGVTQLSRPAKSAYMSIEASILWDRPGSCGKSNKGLILSNQWKSITIQASGEDLPHVAGKRNSPTCLFRSLDEIISITTDSENIGQTQAIIEKQRQIYQDRRNRYGEKQDLYDAMQSCLAWNTIYDPDNDKILSPVSRIWSCERGGWVLFEWDTYFAAWMAAMEDKELAYANVRAITSLINQFGFVPNAIQGDGYASRDRSQPPVGSITVKAICDIYNEKVLAKELFDELLTWNRWWPENRDHQGYLCWGSNPDYRQPLKGLQIWRLAAIHSSHGAALESGLDNSPMYDKMPFNKKKNIMELADVGLMSLFIADTRSLADLARRLSRVREAEELERRAKKYSEKLSTLWDDETGLYLNKNLKTGRSERRLSPTHFYPLLTGIPTQKQARRMIDKHFFNAEEFYGSWILPSISRNDPAYGDQSYWRGRIWAPMNFLVYLGIRNYDLPEARRTLVEKSAELLRKEWHQRGHVHENYCANTGEGCNDIRSDSFYHWGGLLGLISILDESPVR